MTTRPLIDRMAEALRPQLSKEARLLVEEYIDAALASDDPESTEEDAEATGKLAGALEFLLRRQDAAWPLVREYDSQQKDTSHV